METKIQTAGGSSRYFKSARDTAAGRKKEEGMAGRSKLSARTVSAQGDTISISEEGREAYLQAEPDHSDRRMIQKKTEKGSETAAEEKYNIWLRKK